MINIYFMLVISEAICILASIVVFLVVACIFGRYHKPNRKYRKRR